MTQGTCDRERKCRDGLWRRCGRRAAWRRWAASGHYMEACDKHKDWAAAPSIESFRPAPFSEIEPLGGSG